MFLFDLLSIMKRFFYLFIIFITFFVCWNNLYTHATGDTAQNIWNITARFCSWDDNIPSLTLMADGGKTYEICINFFNSTTSDASIDYSFVDWVITNDEYQNKACTISDMANFGQFVQQENASIIVPARWYVQQKAYLKFPTWIDWVVNWCLVYSLSEEKADWNNSRNSENWGQAMLGVQLRKASFIDVIVWWDIYRDLTLGWKIKAKFSRKDKVLSLFFPLSNKWNVNERSTVSGNISNRFGYNSILNQDEKIIISDSDFSIHVPVDNIPRYRLFYHVKWNIISNSDLNVDPSLLEESLRTPIIIPFNFTVFIFPWLLLFILIGLICLIRLIRYLSKHLTFTFHK